MDELIKRAFEVRDALRYCVGIDMESDCARTNYCPNCGADMRGGNDER